MNKVLEKTKYDIDNGLSFLKIGIMNALATVEKEGKSIVLGKHVPFSLVVECAEERGWKEDETHDFDTNGWEHDCWYYMITPNNLHVYIESCLWKGCITKVQINESVAE